MTTTPTVLFGLHGQADGTGFDSEILPGLRDELFQTA